MRRFLGSLAVALTLGSAWAVAVAHPAAAQSSETIRSYDVELAVQPNGDLSVVETIVYDFGTEPRHGIYREIPTRLHYDDTIRPGVPAACGRACRGRRARRSDYTIEDAGRRHDRDQDRGPRPAITGDHDLSDRLHGAGRAERIPEPDELYWNAIGDEWSGP